MKDREFCLHRLQARDAEALIGILARLEGESLAGQLDRGTAAYLQRRLAEDGLLGESSTARDLRQALNDLGHRLRYVLGEHPSPPSQMVVD